MNYAKVTESASKVTRSCWNGIWVEGGKTLCWVHGDKPGKVNKQAFVPTAAELSADDWNVFSDDV